MHKGHISNFLRRVRLLSYTDWLRYYTQKIKYHKINKNFVKRHPDVKLPPDYLIYESFQLNYERYYTGGIEVAKWLAGYFSKYIDLKNRWILDWGCGPGRIIRHLPEVIGNGCEYFGTDYNKRSADWCSRNLTGIHFDNNSLKAELPYDNNFADIIYGISVFTHLSEELHYAWYKELYRVLKPDGIMFLTTQGDNFRGKLTGQELELFNNDQLVVRGGVKEGHRTYSAFQPQGFMRRLFSNSVILEHTETKPENGRLLPQDIWIIKKQ